MYDEDNLYIGPGRLAKSSAEQVENFGEGDAAGICWQDFDADATGAQSPAAGGVTLTRRRRQPLAAARRSRRSSGGSAKMSDSSALCTASASGLSNAPGGALEFES